MTRESKCGEGSVSEKVRRGCEMHGPPLGAPVTAGERREQV